MDHDRTPLVPAAQSQPAEDPAPHPERAENATPGSGDSDHGTAGRDLRPQASSTEQPLLSPTSEGRPTHPRSQDNPYADFERPPVPPPHARSRDGHVRLSSRRQIFGSTAGLPGGAQNASGIDWIVPVEDKATARRTVGERLQATIDNAVRERDKYAQKALWTGYILNIAIGLQVLLGALTTGLSAAVTTAKQAQVSTALLGGLATMVASYLARARGSGEPELSIMRVKDLEQFLRECRGFQIDHAHEYGTPQNGLDEHVIYLRRRFEELLGNANAERKLSPVGITPTQAQAAP